MNAAARLVHQNVLSRHLVLTHRLSWRQMAALMLGLGIMLSALEHYLCDSHYSNFACGLSA